MLIVLAVGLTLLAQPEFCGPALGVRCGRIVIEGNIDTPDRVILECINIRPGQKLQFGELQRAQAWLRATGVFRVNPWRGTGPTVELLYPGFESEFWDVVIRVEERPSNWLAFGMVELFECMIFLCPESAVACWERLTRRACEEAAPNTTSSCPQQSPPAGRE
jgi:hypothetical protein